MQGTLVLGVGQWRQHGHGGSSFVHQKVSSGLMALLLLKVFLLLSSGRP